MACRIKKWGESDIFIVWEMAAKQQKHCGNCLKIFVNIFVKYI